MIGDIFKLSLALILGLVGWGVFEHSQWDQDYAKYQAPVLSFPTPDQTFQKHINPSLFANATVITNDTNLRYPEDIAVSNDGTIYTGLADGSVVSVREGSNATTTVYHHNDSGRIYGIIISSDDSTLYYVTEFKGLVKLDIPSRTPTVLLQSLKDGKPAYFNNLCIDEDNQIIYVTESGPIRMAFSNKEVLLKHAKGRILAYHILTGTSTVVLQNLAFPNGIVYQKSTHSIIFSEINRYSVSRYRIGSGKKEVLLQNTFGYADNLKLNDQGQLCIGMTATRDLILQFMNEKPAFRKFLIYAPERLIYAIIKKRAGGIKVNTTTGQITEYIFGAPSKASFLTTLLQKNGKTYFGSLRSPTILVLNNTSFGPSAGRAQENQL